jgi:hypothetical protein
VLVAVAIVAAACTTVNIITAPGSKIETSTSAGDVSVNRKDKDHGRSEADRAPAP